MDNLSERKQVHRADDLILRPVAPWTKAVHALLRHLETVGFAAAPRVAGTGFAPDGRDSVIFVSGEVDAKRVWSNDGIHQLGHLLRQLHEATASFRPPPDAIWQPSILRPNGQDAVVSHGDAAPWNVVARDGLPVALIDWELAGPVDRLREIAYTAWLNVRLFDDAIAAEEGLPSAEWRAQRLRLFADGYGLSGKERASLVGGIIDVAILSCADDALETQITPGSTGPLGLAWGVAWKSRSAAWIVSHRDLLEQALR